VKTRRLVAAFVLLASLLASSISVTAGEKLGSIQTELGNTTIGGYVDSSVSWRPQTPTQHEHGGWWWDFMLWFGFHGR
jgi:hypothetical protein